MASLPTGRKRVAGPGASIASRLLAWYDAHHRELPWRVPPRALAAGARPDPYAVWLSEIMLQQTTVEAVKPYYRAFLTRWPTVAALAAAPVEEVMSAWAGLGYYSRARNLKKCADAVAAYHGGRFPDTEPGLRALPGIGAYTAAAVAAIAFNRPEPVVDGNVERVTARLFCIAEVGPRLKAEVRRLVAGLVPGDRPGDFAQAMMDLGATICTPRRPSCMICPLREDCGALAEGDPERYPAKTVKAERPQRRGAAFVAMRQDGAVLLRRRPENGLLGGMSEVPGTVWGDEARGAEAAPFKAAWREAGAIGHVFTHFSLDLAVFVADVGDMAAPAGYWWSSPEAIGGEALPTVMRKAIARATEEESRPARTKRNA